MLSDFEDIQQEKSEVTGINGDGLPDYEKDQQNKLLKLKRMRFTAASLLIFMSFVYFTCKKFAPDNLFFSSVIAFSEAAMVGALADWFAVVALFRHPMGMSWIPHTAIIPKNQDRIGESLAGFVVSNFFTAEIIKSKLSGISFVESIVVKLRENKQLLSGKMAAYLPDAAQTLLNNNRLSESFQAGLKNKLREIELYPLLDSALPGLVSSELHIPLVKNLLAGTYDWVSENKDKTLRIIEGMNKTLTFPMIGDLVYKFLLRTLGKLVEDMENGVTTDFNWEVLHALPNQLVREFKSKDEYKEKVEKLKNDFVESEWFANFVSGKMLELRESMISYSFQSSEELSTRILNALDNTLGSLLQEETVKTKIDDLIKDAIVNVVYEYRHQIAALIKDTVSSWPIGDMVDKLETQVGGDLQYIRINGTVIGGLAGLTIYWITIFIK